MLEAGIFSGLFFFTFFTGLNSRSKCPAAKMPVSGALNNPAGSSSNLLSADLTAAITAPRFGC